MRTVTTCGGHSKSATRAIAPAAFRASAIKSRMMLALPSRNWIRYCMVRIDQWSGAASSHERWMAVTPFARLSQASAQYQIEGAVGRIAGDRKRIAARRSPGQVPRRTPFPPPPSWAAQTLCTSGPLRFSHRHLRASASPCRARHACRSSLRSPVQRGPDASPSCRNWPHARAGAQRNRRSAQVVNERVGLRVNTFNALARVTQPGQHCPPFCGGQLLHSLRARATDAPNFDVTVRNLIP
jgi:hypothetical protein